MNRFSFHEFAKGVPSPLLLLDLNGLIVAARPDGTALWADGIVGQSICDVVRTPNETVLRYLRICAKNTQPVVGALSFLSPATNKETPCRCEGVGVRSKPGEPPDQLLLRLTPRDKTHSSKFAELTRSLEEKNRTAAHRWRELAELQRHESQLRALIDATQDAVVFIDETARIVRINKATEDMFGFSWDELRRQPLTMLMPTAIATEHDGYIERYEQTGERRAIGKIRAVTGRRKDGELLPLELSVTDLGPGHSARYGAFLRDVSERQRLQEQLLERERLATIGTTAAIFAHEVGNPLNGMSMNAQLVMRRLAKLGVETDPRLERSMNAVLTEITRLTSLLGEFRMLSKRQTFQISPVLLQDLAQQLLEQEADNYRALGVEFVAELPSEPVWVRADADKLKQALLNLAKNGAEAIENGGTLTLRISVDSNKVRIAIEDTGPGIPDDVDVFALFATTKPSGSGLGLPIVRNIVAAHGGELTCEGCLGGGTRFVIELPEGRR